MPPTREKCGQTRQSLVSCFGVLALPSPRSSATASCSAVRHSIAIENALEGVLSYSVLRNITLATADRQAQLRIHNPELA